MPQFEAGDGWQWKGLGKAAFLTANRARFEALLVEVNNRLRKQYPADLRPLTLLDLYVLIYCEAGFRNGSMNADARHSLGERGLLPLPSNLGFWIGGDAPAYRDLLSLGRNITNYGHYLGAVKNKPVRSSRVGMLYSGLFRSEAIAGHPQREAKLLAGVIHGYFLDRNYHGGEGADLKHLVKGYAEDMPVDQLLAGSGYVHEGTGILRNRQSNIYEAIRAYRGMGNR